jgi:hypothetical protein
MSKDQAFISTGEETVAVPFDNFSANKLISDPIIRPEYSGALVIFNGLDEILKKKAEHNSATEKLIDGLSAEISVSLAGGSCNIYYCSFEKFSDFTRFDLPDEFTTLEEDRIYYLHQERVMAKFINSCLPEIKKVRFIGMVKKSELESLAAMIDDEIEIEIDSPFLVAIDG